MISLLIFLLAAIVLTCLIFKCPLAGWLPATVAVLVVAVGCGLVPGWLLSWLQGGYASSPSISWGKHNVIFLQAAGTEYVPDQGATAPGLLSYAGLVEAASLYRQCRESHGRCTLVVSGSDPVGNGVTEAAVYRNALTQIGVAITDILLEPESRNTWQSAQFARGIVAVLHPNRVLLVSSASHLPRSVLYFRHFGIDAMPVRADYLRAKLSVLPISYNFFITDLALREYVGIAKYHVYNTLWLNPPRFPVFAPSRR